VKVGAFLGIFLPILAQFAKVMVVQGITFPKILAVTYFGHWLMLELLLTLALNCDCNPRDLAMGVDAHLSDSYRSFEENESASADARRASLVEDTNYESSSEESNAISSEAASDDTVAEIQREVERWPFDQWENSLMYFHLIATPVLFSTLGFIAPKDTEGHSVMGAKGKLASALLLGLAMYPLHSKRYILVEGRPGSLVRPSKRPRLQYRPYSRRRNDPIFGGYVVGGDLGTASLVLWLCYCLVLYDSKSTSRPSWPWLDVLG
jgi:hypothetical protein